MNLRFYITAITIMLCSILYANNIESWNTVQGSTKIGRFTYGVSEELRLGTDQTQTTKKIDEIHTTAFVDFAVVDWLSVGVQNDYALLRNHSDARYKHDNRPGVNLTLKKTFYGFNVSNRSRFVLRDLQGECPYFRYRNLTKVFTPTIYNGNYLKNVKLFAAYEWYFDEGSKDRYIRKNDKFSQFWTDFGVRFSVCDNCSVDLFYRLVEVKSATTHDWSPGHVVGTGVSVSF